MLKYSLRKNNLQPEVQNYVARIEGLSSWGFKEIQQEVTREGSILKDVETQAVISEFFKLLARYMSRGIAFQSEYFSLVPSLKGTFTDQQDHFDPARHELCLHMYPGTALKQALAGMSLEKTTAVELAPVLMQVLDNQTDTYNQSVSSGVVTEIWGDRLKIVDPADQAQGVFFVKTDDLETFRVDVLKVNRPSYLSFKAPLNMLPGTYRLEVRTNYGKTVATLKTGALKESLELN